MTHPSTRLPAADPFNAIAQAIRNAFCHQRLNDEHRQRFRLALAALSRKEARA
jgi:hypothetical protein